MWEIKHIRLSPGRIPMQTLEDGKQIWQEKFLVELDLTVTNIKPVTVRSNLNYYR